MLSKLKRKILELLDRLDKAYQAEELNRTSKSSCGCSHKHRSN